MAHEQFVMMAVKCLGKMCVDCPNLHVDNNTSDLSVQDLEGGIIEQHSNLLYCRGYKRCLKIKQMMEEEYDKRSS